MACRPGLPITGATATLAGVPALLRYADSPESAAEFGTVLFCHGFSGTKERMEPYVAITETCQRLVAWFQRWLPR